MVLGFLRCVRDEFTDDVSETAVGPIFTGHELETRQPHRNPKTKKIIYIIYYAYISVNVNVQPTGLRK